MSSAYGNPQPYPDMETERHALLGRLRVATVCARSSRPTTAARWKRVVDELLDHLNQLEARAQSARIQLELEDATA